MIISNEFCPPLIFLYLTFPNSSFPVIFIPFILYIVILIVCFAIYGWRSYCYFNLEHIKYVIILLLLAITICVLFSISPIFVHIFILYLCASLAKRQILWNRYAIPKFGYLRDINHYFNQQILRFMTFCSSKPAVFQ